ncbi:hypothetical protein ACOSP7_017203 [Xanthoceras sorbifolium]
MSSKKYDDAECYERNIIHDVVFLEDGIYELVEDLFLDDFFERCPFHVFLSQLSTINQQ